MKVTDLDYALEDKLLTKLDIMINRCTDKKVRKDAVLIIEGAEGEGKTNTSEAIAYYAKYKMNRPIHMFFRLEQLTEFAKSTENKIIIWDEPALDSLSTDWYRETNKNLIRLLMTCRKKRHFFIFNFVKFYKFSEYVVVDRALGLIHMYSRTGQKAESGRFRYIKMGKLEKLFVEYRKNKVRGYKKCSAFGGSFPIVEQHIEKMGINIEGIENATLEDYEKLKDKSIASIGTEKKKDNPDKIRLNKLLKNVGCLKLPIKNQEELAEQLGVSRKTIHNWQCTEQLEKK